MVGANAAAASPVANIKANANWIIWRCSGRIEKRRMFVQHGIGLRDRGTGTIDIGEHGKAEGHEIGTRGGAFDDAVQRTASHDNTGYLHHIGPPLCQREVFVMRFGPDVTITLAEEDKIGIGLSQFQCPVAFAGAAQSYNPLWRKTGKLIPEAVTGRLKQHAIRCRAPHDLRVVADERGRLVPLDDRNQFLAMSLKPLLIQFACN